MNNNKITEPTPAELNEFIEAYQNATPETQEQARAILQSAVNDAGGTIDPDDEYRGFILQAFDHAAGEMMNDETKAEARRLVKAYFGADNPADASPAMCLMTGFLMGMNEGMKIADVFNAAAAAQAAQ